MRLIEFTEKVFYESKYEYLYHMTDSSGFAYAMAHDFLTALRQKHVSTTFNPNINHIQGRDHIAFKFVLDAPLLLKTYGGYDYVDTYTAIGTTGNSKKNYKEDEIRINTEAIKPLSSYLKRVVIMTNLFSAKMILWLSSRPSNDNHVKAEYPIKAIEGIYAAIFEHNIPVSIMDYGKERDLTDTELDYIKDIHILVSKGMKSEEIVASLIDKYKIYDYDNKTVFNRNMVERKKRVKDIQSLLNGYYASRKYRDVDVNRVKNIISAILKILKVDQADTIFKEMEDNKLFHPTTAPVDWSIVLKDIIKDEPFDEIIETIQWIGENNAHKREYFDDKDGMSYHTVHSATMMT